MADLNGVIRFRRYQLDEKRQTLAELQRLATGLAHEQARLEQSIETEKQASLTVSDTQAAFAFGAFVQSALDRRKRIEQSRAQLETQIEGATEEVRGAFNELKKFEQTEAQRQAREAQRRAHVESMQLDEVGIEGFPQACRGTGVDLTATPYPGRAGNCRSPGGRPRAKTARWRPLAR